jgi:DNA-3-methyladenine glycosylase
MPKAKPRRASKPPASIAAAATSLPTTALAPKRSGPLGAAIRRLRRSELPVDTVELAKFLIGKTLVRNIPGGIAAGRIVETEAYLEGDAASHFYRGPTKRNRSVYLERGHSYVYFCYGAHFMFNVSSEREGVGGGILIRALEPLAGIEWMKKRRGTDKLLDIARGPGRLAEALAIGPKYDGVDLTSPSSELWLGTSVRETGAIAESVRIGITKDAHRVLRFYERGNPYVSGSKKMRE